MNKKLPKVFVNYKDKIITNNKDLISIKKNNFVDLSIEDNKVNELLVQKKINDIFSSQQFIYKIKVKITTNEWEKNKIIIAKSNNSLLTIENEIIPICIIKDINIE